MDFHTMKRKALLPLCRKHKIPANGSNLEIANRLASHLKKPEAEHKSTTVKFRLEEENVDRNEKSNKKVHEIPVRSTRSRKAAEVALHPPSLVQKRKRRREDGGDNKEGAVNISLSSTPFEKTKSRRGKISDGPEKPVFVDSGQYGDVVSNGDVEIGVRVTRALRNREVISNEVDSKNNDISSMKKQKGLKDDRSNEEDVGKVAISKTTTRETRSRKRENTQGDKDVNFQIAEEGSKHVSAPAKTKTRRGKMADGVEKSAFVDSDQHGNVEIGVRLTRSLRNREVVSNEANTSNTDSNPMKKQRGLSENLNNEEDVGKVTVSKTTSKETRSRKRGNTQEDTAINPQIAEEGSKRASASEKSKTRRGKMAVGVEKLAFIDSAEHGDVVSNGGTEIGVRVTRSLRNREVVSKEGNTSNNDISPMKKQRGLKENRNNEEVVEKVAISKATTRETRSRNRGNTQGDEAINSQIAEEASKLASAPEKTKTRRGKMADGVDKLAFVNSGQQGDVVSNGDVEIGVRVTRSLTNREAVSNEGNTSNNDISSMKTRRGLKGNQNNEDVGKIDISKTTTRETRSGKRENTQGDKIINSKIAEEGSKRASAPEKTKTRRGKMADGVFVNSGQHGDVVSNGNVEFGVVVTRALRNRENISNEVDSKNNDISPIKTQRGLKENPKNGEDLGEVAISKTATRETRSRKRGNTQGDEAMDSQIAEEGSKRASAPEQNAPKRSTQNASRVDKKDESVSKGKVDKPVNEIQYVSKETRISEESERTPRRSTRKVITNVASQSEEQVSANLMAAENLCVESVSENPIPQGTGRLRRNSVTNKISALSNEQTMSKSEDLPRTSSSNSSKRKQEASIASKRPKRCSSWRDSIALDSEVAVSAKVILPNRIVGEVEVQKKILDDDTNRTDEKSAEDNTSGINHEMNLNVADDLHISKTAEDKPENVCLTDSVLPLMHTSCQETKEDCNDRLQISADDKSDEGGALGIYSESTIGSNDGAFPESNLRGHDTENFVVDVVEQMNACENTFSVHNNGSTEAEIGVHEYDEEASHQHDQVESSLGDGRHEPKGSPICDSTNDMRDGSLNCTELSSCNELSKSAQGNELLVGSVDYPVEDPSKKIILEPVSRIQEEIVEMIQPSPKFDSGSIDESPILERQEVIIENTAQSSLGNSGDNIQQQNVNVTCHVSENVEFVGNSSDESGEGHVKEEGSMMLQELPRKSSTSDAHCHYGNSSSINSTPVSQGNEEPGFSAFEINMFSGTNNGKEGVSVKSSSFVEISEEIDTRESIPDDYNENSVEYHAGDSILMAQTSHSFGLEEPKFADNSMDQKVFLDVEGSVSTSQQNMEEVNKRMEESEEVAKGFQGSILGIKEPCEFEKENSGISLLYSSETPPEKDSKNPCDAESKFDDHVTELCSAMCQVSPLIVRKSSTSEAHCHYSSSSSRNITPVSQESSETKPLKQVQNEPVCLRKGVSKMDRITEDVTEDCIPRISDPVEERLTGDISEIEGKEEMLGTSPCLQESSETKPLKQVQNEVVCLRKEGVSIMDRITEDVTEDCIPRISDPFEVETLTGDISEIKSEEEMLGTSPCLQELPPTGIKHIKVPENQNGLDLVGHTLPSVRFDYRNAAEDNAELCRNPCPKRDEFEVEKEDAVKHDSMLKFSSGYTNIETIENNTEEVRDIKETRDVEKESAGSSLLCTTNSLQENHSSSQGDKEPTSSLVGYEFSAFEINMLSSHIIGEGDGVSFEKNASVAISDNIYACESLADDNIVDTIPFFEKSSEKLEDHAADGIGMTQVSHRSGLDEPKYTDNSMDQKETAEVEESVGTLRMNMEEVNEPKNQMVENSSETPRENDSSSPDYSVLSGKGLDQEEDMVDVEGNIATSQRDLEESFGQENCVLEKKDSESCPETAVGSSHCSNIPQEFRSRSPGIEYTNWEVSQFSGYNAENEATGRSENRFEETTSQGAIESRCKTLDNEFSELDTKLFDGQSAENVVEARVTNESNDCHVPDQDCFADERCETEDDNECTNNIHKQEGELSREDLPETATVSTSYGSDSSLKNEVVNRGENESSKDMSSQVVSGQDEFSKNEYSELDLGELGQQEEIDHVHIDEFSREGSPKIDTGSPTYAPTDIPLQNEVVCQGDDETVDNGLSAWEISLFSENNAGNDNASMETSEAVANEIFELSENENNLEERNVSTSPQKLEELGDQQTHLVQQGGEHMGNEFMHNIDQREHSYGSDFPLENDEFGAWDMSFFSENQNHVHVGNNNDSTFVDENTSCGEEELFGTISPHERYQATTPADQRFQDTDSTTPKNVNMTEPTGTDVRRRDFMDECNRNM